MECILIIDDDPGFQKLLEAILRGEGYCVDACRTVSEAIDRGGRREYHLVISDLKLPDGDGIGILRWFREHCPETPVIMITGFGTVHTAVEAMKLGAVDYLGKPLSSPDELRLLVKRILSAQQTEQHYHLLQEEEQKRFSCGDMIADHPKMLRLMELVRKVAPTNATVLISGESGTGKEIIARCIHMNSQRSGKVFVPVNCAALAPTLIESELFGHEKGAFTGASTQHQGRFERAHGGTLFLDEIGELDGNLQAKLLRVLQEKAFERVGGSRQISVDVRMIAATNRDLRKQVAAGRFREDLYYRLTAFPLEIPPLRERASDVPRLAGHFLRRAASGLGKAAPSLSADAETVLMEYTWPGNVRELENMMERAAILCEGMVHVDDLPVAGQGMAHPTAFKDIERKAIMDALEAHQGNRTRAARQLGISLRTLQYRLKEYGATGHHPEAAPSEPM